MLTEIKINEFRDFLPGSSDDIDYRMDRNVFFMNFRQMKIFSYSTVNGTKHLINVVTDLILLIHFLQGFSDLGRAPLGGVRS